MKEHFSPRKRTREGAIGGGGGKQGLRAQTKQRCISKLTEGIAQATSRTKLKWGQGEGRTYSKTKRQKRERTAIWSAVRVEKRILSRALANLHLRVIVRTGPGE